MTDTVTVALIGGVIGPVIVLSLNYWLNNRKKTDMVAEALVVGEQVSTKLDTIREEYQADRVWLSQFHNGGHFYPTGKSIAKFSIFYETVSSNTTSIQLSLKNIPVALFSRSLNELVANGVVRIPDFKDVTTSTFGLKYFAEEYGTKSQYLFAITNFEGRFIATLGVDYTHKKHKLNEEEISELERMATSLGGVLAKHLKV